MSAPGDTAYATSLLGSGTTPLDDCCPAALVEVAGPDDVRAVLEFTRRRGLGVAVRSGGHDVFAASTPSSVVVIDLCRLNTRCVDSATGVARVGSGVRAAELTAAAGEGGWVPLVGMHPTVGIGGLTLGGGMGWLSGSFGATVDHLLSAEVVTAAGDVLNATAEENTDLFWALRGGGGNFGVVTSFTFQFHRVPMVYAGALAFRVPPRKFLDFYADFLAATPDGLEVTAIMTTAPDPIAFVMACWVGDADGGRAALRPLMEFGTPEVDTLREQTYGEFVSEAPPGLFDVLFADRCLWRGGELASLGTDVRDVLDRALRMESANSYISLSHYLHGELCRVPPGSTPFRRDEGHVLYAVASNWFDDSEVAEREAKTAWVESVALQMRTVAHGGTYVNYLSDDSEDALRCTFGDSYDRLREIKRTYDPHNVFRHTRNIRPAD